MAVFTLPAHTEEWDVYDELLLEKAVIHRRAPAGGHGKYLGGQFLPARIWEAEKRRAEVDLPDCLARFGDRLQFLRDVYEQQHALLKEGKTSVKLIPLSTVEWRLKAAVRESYNEAFLLGKRAAGNLTSITPKEARAIRKVRYDEFVYLRNFLRDMRTGGGRMPYERRMSMYESAAKELYWVGWILGNLSPERMIRWCMAKAEHCRDCLRLANEGPWLIQDFIRKVLRKGFCPGSGRLECRTNCKCHLEEVEV